MNLSSVLAFERWTNQSGYPVITVEIKSNQMALTQNRFLLRNLDSKPDESLWWVPITWISLKNPHHKQEIYWLKNRSEVIEHRFAEDEVVILNWKSAGDLIKIKKIFFNVS